MGLGYFVTGKIFPVTATNKLKICKIEICIFHMLRVSCLKNLVQHIYPAVTPGQAMQVVSALGEGQRWGGWW